MFTGIIETMGTVEAAAISGTNKTFRIRTSIASELVVDQSISHDGVCLTVEDIQGPVYQVTAIRETLNKSRLQAWKPGDLINLERCLKIDGRLDGHIVQGHVDTTAVCTSRKEINGSWEFRFKFPKKFSALVIEKGSVSLNGISLTVFDVKTKSFSVAIIPYTYEHTNIKSVAKGSLVNIEFDMIGKYLQRKMDLKIP